MVFTKDSALVKIWVKNVQNGKYTLDEVPELFNLKEVVTEVIMEQEQAEKEEQEEAEKEEQEEIN